MNKAGFRAALAAGSVLVTAVLAAAGAQPTAGKTITAVRALGPIKIDGRLVEDAWQTPGYGGFNQTDPQDGAPASGISTAAAVSRPTPTPPAGLRRARPSRGIRSGRGTISAATPASTSRPG
ncbi:MAG: hypothetical protein ABSG73_14770 [Candidatus Aminicenantales bacterium]